MNTYVLTLYVAGHTQRSQHAIANLQHICEEMFPDTSYELNIIDVLEHPDLAERKKILATPTLIKELPPPALRIIGDLSQTQQVIEWIEPQYHSEHDQGGA